MPAPTTGTIVYGKVIDGSLDQPIERGAVVFEADRIRWVGKRDDLPGKYREDPNFEKIDLPGRSVMPGLIDGHTHISFGEARSEEELALYTPVEFRTLKAIWNAKKVLQAGVTSAFDAATTYDVAQAVRDAIDAGMFEGPRFAVSGKQLTTHQGLEDSFPNSVPYPVGQAGVLVKSNDDIIEQIRYQVKDRVDAVKVSGSNDSLITPDSLDGSAFTLEEYQLIAKEVHRLGKMCTVHARSRDSVLHTAMAGFDILFHASNIDEEGIEWALKNNCIINPTLTLLTNIVAAGKAQAGASSSGATQREIDAALTNIPKAYRAGVPLVSGSECGWSPVPYGDWHAREIQTFVEDMGLSTIEAIHTATGAAAKCFKRFGHEIGLLEPGRYADILVVDGDPTKDIVILQDKSKFDYIFKGGKAVDQTPPAPRQEWFFEHHKIFLNAKLKYDPKTRKGYLVE